MGLLDEYVENDAVKVLEVKYRNEGYGVVGTQDTPQEHEGHEGEGVLSEALETLLPESLSKAERSAVYAKISRGRRRDKQTAELSRVYGFVNFGRYACDKSLSVKLLSARSPAKPGWAVRALVLLRTGGLCEVCREEIARLGEVKQLVPVKLGGAYCEVNTIGVCGECVKVWTKKNFFLDAGMDRALVVLKLYVMRRRNERRNDARPLNDVGQAECKRLLSLLERHRLAPPRRIVTEDDADIIRALK